MEQQDMPRPQPEVNGVSAEQIQEASHYYLAQSFDPDVNDTGNTCRDFYENVEYLQKLHRKRNVLTSYYMDTELGLRLGVFIRPLEEEPFMHTEADKMSLAQRIGDMATRVVKTSPNIPTTLPRE